MNKMGGCLQQLRDSAGDRVQWWSQAQTIAFRDAMHAFTKDGCWSTENDAVNDVVMMALAEVLQINESVSFVALDWRRRSCCIGWSAPSEQASDRYQFE